ncbi:unnamed protein product, partial [Staurois parvus]
MGPRIPHPHAAAKSRVFMGPCTGLPLLLSPSPQTLPCATRSVSSHCWWVPFCHIGCLARLRASHCCCQALICMGPVFFDIPPHAVRPSRDTASHGSLYQCRASIAADLHRHTLRMCHYSGLLHHTAGGVPFFVIGC